jgi:hypothetical protein
LSESFQPDAGSVRVTLQLEAAKETAHAAAVERLLGRT